MFKILLVQAKLPLREIMADLLRERDYEVQVLDSGTDALSKVYTERIHFDLLIYDFDLPFLDRIRIALALRAIKRAVPVLVLGGLSSTDSERLMFHCPIWYFDKHVPAEKMLTDVGLLLSRQCRRQNNSQTWHVCTSCNDWPTIDYEAQFLNPASGLELCNECRISIQQGTCI